MKQISHNDVQDGKRYRIVLDEYSGECTQDVTAWFYKKGSHKTLMKAVYRFVDDVGKVIPRRYAIRVYEIKDQ